MAFISSYLTFYLHLCYGAVRPHNIHLIGGAAPYNIGGQGAKPPVLNKNTGPYGPYPIGLIGVRSTPITLDIGPPGPISYT